MSITKQIIALEWKLFDQVHNRGGRAACQDDPQTFALMRFSQLNAWSQELRSSYYHDLLEAKRQGRNLLTEKYAYMMERTNPQEFVEIKDLIPLRIPEKDRMIAEICTIHVAWLEELEEQYPNLTGRGRPIHRQEDSPVTVSFETYLWGELATYSVRTVTIYLEYVRELQREGKNLNEMILHNTVLQYGYSSLEQAERKLR